MKMQKTYWIVSLSLLLLFSMLLPACCDAVAMPSMDHHSEMASHATHGQKSDAQQCECGHELVKKYQKNKKVAASHILPVLNVVDISRYRQLVTNLYISSRLIEQQLGLLKKSGPPIHLLNSVFLN